MSKIEKLGEIISVNAGWLRKSGVPRPGTWFTNRELSGGGVLNVGNLIIEPIKEAMQSSLQRKRGCNSKRHNYVV